MPHMVIFRNADGKTGYHQAETIEDAARFVERLRNHDSVENVRIFKMDEVEFEYRPYFRVEIGAPSRPSETGADDTSSDDGDVKAGDVKAGADAPAAGEGADPLAAIPTPVPVPVAVGEGPAANGKRGIFSR